MVLEQDNRLRTGSMFWCAFYMRRQTSVLVGPGSFFPPYPQVCNTNPLCEFSDLFILISYIVYVIVSIKVAQLK